MWLDPAVRFGLTYLFRNPPHSGRSNSYVIGAKLEQIELAESLGFDDIWVGEHHFVDDGWLPSPLAGAAAVAARTSRVSVGTFATLLALHHPIRLAEDCAVVDNISGGRFLLGAALGYRAKEFELLGIPYRERASRFEETVEILRRCWTEEVFSHAGRHYSFEDVRCHPKPTQRPIPIWIAAIASERALRRAARLGDGWLNGDHSGRSHPRYLHALAEAGKDVTSPQIVATAKSWMFATRDPERDWALLRPHAIAQVQTVRPWLEEAGQAALLDADIDAAVDSMFLVDTPESIVATIRAEYEATPFSRHVHTPVFPGAPLDRCAESVELFANEVLPQLRALGEEPASASGD